MKALKYIFAVLVTVVVATYLSFLFIVPNCIDANKYAPKLTEFVQNSTGFQVNLTGLKIRTSWNLSAGLLAKRADFIYPNGEKFAQINNFDVRVSTIYLLFKRVKFDKISADRALMNIKVKDDGTFLMSDFVGDNLPKSVSVKNVSFPVKFSKKMPKISVKKYRFSFIDMNEKNNYSVKGKNLKISDFILGKKIRVSSKGFVVLNGNQQLSYNVNLSSKYFPEFTATDKSVDSVNIMKVFGDLNKYNLKADIYSNLKIDEDNCLDGKLILNGVTARIDGKDLRQSNAAFRFDGKLVRIDSELYTSDNGRALISGVLNNSKHKYISLKVNSDRTDIGDVFLISNTLLQMIGNKDLNGIDAQGKLNANFNVKSDFKTLQSNGFLRLENARITDNLFNVSLDSIFADINFDNDTLRILKSNALLNNALIELKGEINSNAYSNLELNANEVSVKGILALACQFHVLRANDITNGTVNLKATLKGRLDTARPEINAKIFNLALKNKIYLVRVSLEKATLYLSSDCKKVKKGLAKVENLRIVKNPFVNVFVPLSQISFDDKNVKINKSNLFLNNSKINFYGNILNYNTTKPKTDITIYGLMKAVDIKSMLPVSNKQGISAVGRVPMIIKIKGRDMVEVKVQMLANQQNHIGIFDINTLRNKTSLVNANLVYSQDELRVREAALYALSVNHGLSENFNANIASGTKVAEMFGKISDISKSPVFENLNIIIPNKITTSLPGYEGSTVNLKGELEANGNVYKPQITGYLTVQKANIPTMKTSMRNLVLHFNKYSTSANCRQMLLANSFVSFNAEILNDFSNGLSVKNLDYIANEIDMNALGSVLDQGTVANSNIKILSGKGTIDKFRFGKIVATGLTNDVTLQNGTLKIQNIRGNSFYGKIGGNVIVDLNKRITWTNVQGRGLSAEPAILALIPKSDDIAGKLDFDSKLSFRGFGVSDIQHSLSGNTIFIISNGKMGSLGKLEHLISAQNLLTSNALTTSLNTVVKAFAVKNTGYYKYVKGRVNLSSGVANISAIKAAGPTMSLYITGRYNIPFNSANLIILGRLSDHVVKVLGPIGDLSVSKVFSYIPNLGNLTNNMINQMTTPPTNENTDMIPSLIPATEFATREFKVMIDGDLQSQSSVKYFKWLSSPKAIQNSSRTISSEQVKQTFQSVKQKVQEGAHDVWQQVAPVRPNASSGTNYYTPPKRRQPAEFINTLPDLRS